MKGEAVVAVVGGGAAGLMAAWWAARAGAAVVLLEGSKDVGRKIVISGGGRCNILPVEHADDDFYTSGSRNVLRRLFRTWPLPAVRDFLETELELPLFDDEETGKVFPVCESARTVRDQMRERVVAAGVDLRVPWRVQEIERTDAGFVLRSEGGEELRARAAVLASGGCSVPQTGSDGHGYALAEGLGHSLLPRYPALVPLTAGDRELQELSGVALPVRWRALVDGRVAEERERELLITHRGFSGPAILDASHWAVRDGATIEVAWGGLDEEDWEEHWKSRGRRELARALGDHLPRRLADLLCRRAGLRADGRIGNLTRSQRDRMLATLCHFPLPVDGDEGFRVAEVTGGGVPLGELRPSTLESRACENLYLCGEILDVIGRIGGFNFLWAWITGRLAGEAAAKAVKA